jgi:UDP-N-acetyl-D-glucosamine dehydrogenase
MVNQLEQKIQAKRAVIGVVGLGYIGLSLLDAFGKAGFPLVGYDYNQSRMEMLARKEPYLNFIDHKDLFKLMDQNCFKASSDPSVLQAADVTVISVPTSLDQHQTPNLSNLHAAFNTVYSYLKKDQLIILQSSTYPSTTQDTLLPILENSGLKVGEDFFLAYVPEVADIGNPQFSFTQVPRIISGITPACRNLAEQLYKQIGCKVVLASSTKIAESAKLLQNSYRLLNISFINEMKMMFDRMGLDVWEVIRAAESKPFGFVPFHPSPGVGGDCIPVTPFYLVWQAKATEGPTTLLEHAGHINEMMPHYVISKVVEGLNLHKKFVREAKILVLGVAYKKNVNDIRESPSLSILALLQKMLANVEYHDPFVSELPPLVKHPDLKLRSITLDYEKLHSYDAVIIATDHSNYDWSKIVENSQLVIDTHNVTENVKNAKEKVIKA